MKIPLFKLLKGKLLRIAELQDWIIIELSKKFDFILHGGTAIWRVYGGKRFSFDIDIYHKNPEKILNHFKTNNQIKTTKSRITSSNVVYLRIKDTEEVELEVSPIFKRITPVEKEFWLTDGSSMLIKTLSPEDLVKEKIEAFINRRKSRDLYDIYYLLDFCDRQIIKPYMRKLLPHLEKMPDDFKRLNELVLIGKPPSFETIKEKVMRYA